MGKDMKTYVKFLNKNDISHTVTLFVVDHVYTFLPVMTDAIDALDGFRLHLVGTWSSTPNL